MRGQILGLRQQIQSLRAELKPEKPIFYLSVRQKITPKQIFKLINFKSTKEERLQEKQDSSYVNENDSQDIINKNEYNFQKPLESLEPTIKNHSQINITKNDSSKESIVSEDLKMEVTVAPEEASEVDNLAAKLVADYGEVDPTLELSKFTARTRDFHV